MRAYLRERPLARLQYQDGEMTAGLALTGAGARAIAAIAHNANGVGITLRSGGRALRRCRRFDRIANPKHMVGYPRHGLCMTDNGR